LSRRCANPKCGRALPDAKRSHAITCSHACRQALYRAVHGCELVARAPSSAMPRAAKNRAVDALPTSAPERTPLAPVNGERRRAFVTWEVPTD